MKRILFLMLCIVGVRLNIHAQIMLDYSGYTLTFFDQFDYPGITGPGPATTLGTTGDSSFSDIWWITNDHGARERSVSSEVSLSPAGPGVSYVRLSEHLNPGYGVSDTFKYLTSMIMSKSKTSYGIMQVRARFPKAPHPASPAIWGKSDSEFDFPDDAIYSDWTPFRSAEWTYWDAIHASLGVTDNVNDALLKPLGIMDLTGWHTYTAKWTPSMVTFYVDDYLLSSMPFEWRRIYPTPMPIMAILWVPDSTDAGQSLDIDWVKIFNKTCSDKTLHVFPDICTFFTVNPGEYLYHTISSSCIVPITTVTQNATLFEAQSTVIQSQFLADESSSITGYYPDFPDPHAEIQNFGANPLINLVKKNGYFEIKALPSCEAAPPCSLGEISGYSEICRTDVLYHFTNSTLGGTWQVENSDIVINPKTGDINGLSIHSTSGTVTITYWVGICHVSKTITIGDCEEKQANPSYQNQQSIENDEIFIYPNPANDRISIAFPCKSAGLLEINIKDINGRMQYSENISCDGNNSIQHDVNISFLIPGVYIVELTLNGRRTIKKIVKLNK